MAFSDTFAHMLWSSTQARYTAIALGVMVIAVSIGTLVSRGVKPGVKVAAIVAFVIGVIPSVFFSLMQINCIVEGGRDRAWCNVYAWFISAVIILLSSLVVIAVTFAIMEGRNIAEREAFEDNKKKIDSSTKDYMNESEGTVEGMENPEEEDENDDEYDTGDEAVIEGMETKDDDEVEQPDYSSNADDDKDNSDSVAKPENFTSSLNVAEFAPWQ